MSNAHPSPTTSGHTIDVSQDHLIALARLSKYYERRTGRRIDRTVPYRWSRRGIDNLRLPTVRIGGRRFTSQEAFAWWCSALARAGDSVRSVAARLGRRELAIRTTSKVAMEVRP